MLRAKAIAPFGTLVVDATGRTLYRSDRDRAAPAALALRRRLCEDLAAGHGHRAPTRSGSPASTRTWSALVRRQDGRLQLTLAGHPLYRFAKDRRPGDLKGQCKDGVFFAATPEGGKTTMVGRPQPALRPPRQVKVE